MHITSLARLNRLARFSVVSMSTISRRIELTDAPVIVSMQQAHAVCRITTAVEWNGGATLAQP